MITDELIDLICSFKCEDVSEAAERKLRSCLVDTIGVTIAGREELKGKERLLKQLLGDTVKTVAPIGSKEKTSVVNAILINGLNSHILELDDGVRYGVVHPSAPMFSALIPLVQVTHVPWKQFVLGAICGYEVSIRIATSMQPSHYSVGYHPTATCCTLGVAVAIAVMLGFTREEVKDALSAASISASGTLKVLEDVSQLKAYNCAKAALNGYYAAMMAKAGFKGPKEALDGETGFLNMMSSSWCKDVLTSRNDFLYVEKVYQKPYASCRHTHPEIEACFKIRKNDGFNVNDVEKVEVRTYKGVVGKHDFKDIHGEASARMSIPYSVAISLTTGRAGIAEFTEPYVTDGNILSLAQRVTVLPDEEFSRLVPDKRVAEVVVVMKDGTSMAAKVDYPKGEPENPLTEEESMIKFLSMTSFAGIANDEALKIYKEIQETEAPDIDRLW